MAEQDCLLRMIATHTMAACAPLALGSVKRQDLSSVSYLILQHIPLAVHGDWFSAGQQLAQMHQHTTDQGYGFEHITWCGESAQDNHWNNNWSEFFIGQRLQPLLSKLRERGIHFANGDRALQRAKDILEHHQPAASLLHGDLWSGNIGFNPDKHLSYPVLFDPASYYGDAETDLAMTELFGRFPTAFYDGYNSINPLPESYEQRRPVYQLYHLLNHALLFGGSYIPQTESLLVRL
ncbi:MAG: fructosamine kinase family protein [Saccharospirillaceae bacterium]|nr:fructosamine kinase family protein [Saccharospirillaceae bacterium]